jgi:capsular polysaccharide transport system permease protein
VTKAYVQPTLLDNLKVQYQVIRALMLRQILLRWGRNNLGYLWLFLEPLIIIAVIAGFVSLFQKSGFEKAHIGIDALSFMFLGLSSAWTWRFTSQKCGGAFSGNIPLLEHRFIRPLDLFLSAAVIEILGVSAAFVVIYVFLMFIGLMALPQNLPLLIMAWVLMCWFALAYGIFFGALSGAFDFFEFAMRGVSVIFYITSGVFFAVVWLPPEYRDVALINPMIHGTEMLRHAYFGDKLETFEDPAYLIAWNVGLTFLALLIARASWLEDIRE